MDENLTSPDFSPEEKEFAEMFKKIINRYDMTEEMSAKLTERIHKMMEEHKIAATDKNEPSKEVKPWTPPKNKEESKSKEREAIDR